MEYEQLGGGQKIPVLIRWVACLSLYKFGQQRIWGGVGPVGYPKRIVRRGNVGRSFCILRMQWGPPSRYCIVEALGTGTWAVSSHAKD
jgi:hypothetical protein